jgi:hypothetical protein
VRFKSLSILGAASFDHVRVPATPCASKPLADWNAFGAFSVPRVTSAGELFDPGD